MYQTEYEKMEAAYIRSEVKERAHPEVKYPFRTPIVKSMSEGGDYICRICDHSGNGTGAYAASGSTNDITTHIHKHRENGEW